MSKLKLSEPHVIETTQGENNLLWYAGIKATDQMGDMHAWTAVIKEAYTATPEKLDFIIRKILSKVVDEKTLRIIPLNDATEKSHKQRQSNEN